VKYPRDITQIIELLAETPGVQRVIVVRVDGDRLATCAVFPSRSRLTSPVLLLEGECLKIEGEWEINGLPQDGNLVDFLNQLRESVGQKGIVGHVAELGEGEVNLHNRKQWSGDMLIGFTDE
jgi:hypothetical protein